MERRNIDSGCAVIARITVKAKVVELKNDHHAVVEYDGSEYLVSICDLDPIPLDNEWLKQLGFDKHLTGVWECTPFGDKRLMVYGSDSPTAVNGKSCKSPDFPIWTATVLGLESTDVLKSVKISSVNELQCIMERCKKLNTQQLSDILDPEDWDEVQ